MTKTDFKVSIVRSSHRHLTLTIKADNRRSAEAIGLATACDHEFPGEKDAEYSLLNEEVQRETKIVLYNNDGVKLFEHTQGGNTIKETVAAALAQDANLTAVMLNSADLSGVDFSNAYLYDGNFIGADLRETKWSKASIHRCRFDHADLRGAEIKDTNINGVTFDNSNWEGHVLDEINVANAGFAGALFSEATLIGTPGDPVRSRATKYEETCFVPFSHAIKCVDLNGKTFNAKAFEIMEYNQTILISPARKPSDLMNISLSFRPHMLANAIEAFQNGTPLSKYVNVHDDPEEKDVLVIKSTLKNFNTGTNAQHEINFPKNELIEALAKWLLRIKR